jgi:hypothetical protein
VAGEHERHDRGHCCDHLVTLPRGATGRTQ